MYLIEVVEIAWLPVVYQSIYLIYLLTNPIDHINDDLNKKMLSTRWSLLHGNDESYDPVVEVVIVRIYYGK